MPPLPRHEIWEGGGAVTPLPPPPTSYACLWPGSLVWGQLLLASLLLPLPTSWGWIKTTDGVYEP